MIQKITGGQALAAALQRWGVDTLFGLPGVHLDHFFDALHPLQDKIRVIHTRHEQGAAYMALGHAMASGRPGVFTVVPGPGVLNAGAALATAYSCYAPVLCITSTVSWPLLEKNYGSLHELPDQPGILSRLCKWSARANHPAEIPDLVDEAFRQMLTGSPRPVALEIPPEVLGRTGLVQIASHLPEIKQPLPDPENIEAVAHLLSTAKEPLMIVGGGAKHAGEEIRELAERFQIPVISRQMGRGILSDKHPLSLVAAAGHKLWTTADLVIGIGTRLQQLHQWGMDDKLKLIRIDIDAAEIDRFASPEVAILADAKFATAALIKSTMQQNNPVADRAAAISQAREDFKQEAERNIGTQISYLKAIRAQLPEDGILVDELTQVGHVAKLVMPIYHPRGLITSGYQGTLGYGFATALGAQIAEPDRKVLSINGDGGFMYTMPELATAALHKIPLVSVVFDDQSYGNVETIQERWYGGRVIATRLHNPNFCALAESFGVMALHAKNPEELGTALESAFAACKPVLIEVPVTREEMGWPWSMIINEKLRG